MVCVMGRVALCEFAVQFIKILRLALSRLRRSTVYSVCRAKYLFCLWALLIVALTFLVPSVSFGQLTTTIPLDTDVVTLEVVVTPKTGPPVSGLQQQDFTILDNKVPQTITSFQAFRGREAPIEVILVIDDVNTGLQHIAYERSEIDKFLRIDSGSLAHPIALAVFTDSGTKIQDEFTTDGKALSAVLDQYTIGLHSIPRAGGVYSEVERFQLSLVALHQIAVRELTRPGRKIILWISPGWPLLADPSTELGPTERQQVFMDVVTLSTLLRQAGITLYSIDPLGSEDFGKRSFHWEAFVKGVSKANEAEWGNIALQVLAVQSGGLALNTSNNLSGLLSLCLADTQAYYELSFAPSLNQKKNEYHLIEVRVAKAGVSARTRKSYYSQVTPSGSQ